MIESTDKNRCPNGTFFGWWGGYVCWVIIDDTKYEWNLPEGIRSPSSRQVIRVERGKAFINPSETWDPNQLPEVDFKHIKVVYTKVIFEEQRILSKTLTVPLRWKYTTWSEHKIADDLGISAEDIINILNYEE